MKTNSSISLWLLCVCLFAVVGCGGAGGDEEPKSLLGPSSEQAMLSLKDMLQGIEKEKAPMPRGIPTWPSGDQATRRPKCFYNRVKSCMLGDQKSMPLKQIS